jgi:integral membrane protein (TIGR01906 family)
MIKRLKIIGGLYLKGGKYILILILKIIAAVILTIILVLTNLELIVSNMEYFDIQYQRYDVYNNLSIDKGQLLDGTRHLIDYLKGREDNLDIPVTLGGDTVNLFNAKEIAHLEDVRVLFEQGYRLRLWSVLVLAIFLVIIYRLTRRGRVSFLKSIRHMSLYPFVLIGLLALAFITDFNRYFTYFHLIFFTNDLWMLNPKTDRLIVMYPEGFFMDTALLILGLFVIEMAVIFTVSSILMKHKHGTGK